MAMAASISLSRSTTRSHTSFPSRFAAASPKLPRFVYFARNPSWRTSASMSIEAPEKELSFLERKESGFLHFVKYHGLGNDFILVFDAPPAVLTLLFSFF